MSDGAPVRSRKWTRRRARALLRHSGPTSIRFRTRLSFMGGAVLIGLVALIFAQAADLANHLFHRLVTAAPLLPLVLTPAMFALLAWASRRFAPYSGGSGIPQVIAAIRMPPASPLFSALLSLRSALLKCVLTVGGLLAGASVGREGPTVQISAAILTAVHQALRVPVRSATIIAGGAAGVAAAFNTPIAGVTFAIEELASSYEQRTTLLIMAAVIISGMVALGLAGDYLYFGLVTERLPFAMAIVAIPLAGVFGGLTGGLFSRLLLGWNFADRPWLRWLRARPVRAALVCGIVVALVGYGSGMSWGTGYEPARAAITGEDDMPLWFGAVKFLSTLATAVSGIPGGIFAPSLATGAGLGNMLHAGLPDMPEGPIILLGMVAYFTGVVRAPLTAVIVITETTASRGLLLPLLATAIIADAVAGLVCRERLYHGLAHKFAKAG
ncbi:MAG TPA: chloride channel protein [Sphingobium sp.]|uniref:chloride channel protein n=1 Tax=Sphingobium sp. TaxID=1912891 RepID=UPI002ED5043D